MPCVYVLTNITMPGLVKIGYSATNTAAERAMQISSGTGVPAPFSVAWYAETQTGAAANQLETLVHRALAVQRQNQSREFFTVTVDRAREVIEQIGHATGLINITSTEIAQRAAAIRAEEAARIEAAAATRAEQDARATAMLKEKEHVERVAQIRRLELECTTYEREQQAHANRGFMEKANAAWENIFLVLILTGLFAAGFAHGIWFVGFALFSYFLWHEREDNIAKELSKTKSYNQKGNEIAMLKTVISGNKKQPAISLQQLQAQHLQVRVGPPPAPRTPTQQLQDSQSLDESRQMNWAEITPFREPLRK